MMKLKPAHPIARTIALSLDTCFIFAVAFLGAVLGGTIAVFLFSEKLDDAQLRLITTQAILASYLFWTIAGIILNFVALEGLTGSSLGKKICGIQVTLKDGSPIGASQAFGRTFCFFVAGMPFYAGYLMLFFSKYSQCWHDRICDSFVTRTSHAAAIDLEEAEPMPLEIPKVA